jgi:chitodextrinase
VHESNLTQMTIPAGTLEYDTSYHWQVSYQDSQGSWSSWSAETGFSTSGLPTVLAALLIAAAVVGVVAVVAMTAPLMLPMWCRRCTRAGSLFLKHRMFPVHLILIS